jgi:hypothetical protein
MLNTKVTDEHDAHPILLLLLTSSAAYVLATSLFLTLALVALLCFVVNNVKDAKSVHPARRLRRRRISEIKRTT